MNMNDLPLTYNAVDILEHNLAERADKTGLYSRSRNMTFAEVAAESKPGWQRAESARCAPR